jgi:hypothetical protein
MLMYGLSENKRELTPNTDKFNAKYKGTRILVLEFKRDKERELRLAGGAS